MQFDVISPIDQSVLTQIDYTSDKQLFIMIEQAKRAQKAWAQESLAERQACCQRFVAAMFENQSQIGLDISQQMGRPLKQAENEVLGLQQRAEAMIEASTQALSDVVIDVNSEQQRFMKKQALGLVMVIAPWNYPLLTAVNVIVPAILAGNAVLLKHSSQTPLCANHFKQAFEQAGLPHGLFQTVFLTHQATDKLLQSPFIDFVSFTGSVKGGRSISQSISHRFINATLELGGKDAAYVRNDADITRTATEICDGAFYNAGQSCCGIERIYVHRDIYTQFIDALVANTYQLKQGHPLEQGSTLGPMAKMQFANAVREQLAQAITEGAKPLIDEKQFGLAKHDTAYCAPQILTEVTHDMAFMQQEVFGPAVGVMAVDSDEQAIELINDSDYGLTASVWTQDIDAALELGNQVQVGTWFMNRCDYLDPALAWTGVKDSGKGLSLSSLAFNALTRLQSFNMRVW